ncbi:substrate-binding periplasmic protein [Spartinivicinus poritis]|uniref:Transporter substrate-binding domain-containing protein n=1 Tax=Spartinivicinus poritis TaxID=2994640 RepID=A0ABT5U468_9GAMM|nr:transporter substrate-binding domain-containing protein [Spartinivicinus sp. A2-2]MDE1460771.1 transporter substrate-binding domain-containing protein [Spartinivicinus sp. A2-2]
MKISTGEYPPWSSKDFKHGGFVHHIISEAFKRKGYKVAFIYHKWARSYKEGLLGHVHATAYWMCVAKRKKHFYCSDPLYEEDYVFFHLKSTEFTSWKTLSSLGQYRIGATRGYTYTEAFWDAEKTGRLNIIVNNTDEISFNMLLRNRLDIFVTGSVAGYSLLHKKFPTSFSKQITYNSKPLVSNTQHLLFPKNKASSIRLLEIFNDALKSMKEDGSFEKYYDQLIEGYYEKP